MLRNFILVTAKLFLVSETQFCFETYLKDLYFKLTFTLNLSSTDMSGELSGIERNSTKNLC